MAGLWATHRRVRYRADNGNLAWRRVGCWLSEIPTAVDRSTDNNPGERVPGWR